MTDTQIKEHINKVHARNINWEINKGAFKYGQQLWEATLQCIENVDTNDDKTNANQTYHILSLTGSLSKCLTDNFRKIVISYHARGLTTSQAIDQILYDEDLLYDTPFHVFKFSNVCGYDNIKKFLLQRISYLKPTDPRWPHKKFGEYWKNERQEYLNAIDDIPLSNKKEQIAALFDHFTTLNTHFNAVNEAIDIERLHRCKLQTIVAINSLTRTTEVDINQQAVFHKNTTNILLEAISGTPAENQLHTQIQKQLASPKQQQKLTTKNEKKSI